MLKRAPLRVALLCSHRAPGLDHLLAANARGRQWEIVCCLTSEESFAGEDAVIRAGVPVVRHSVRRFYEERGEALRPGNYATRAMYDRRTVQLLAEFRPNVALLAGYLLLLTKPMLQAYENRILNVHHADLLLRDAAGAPRYPGLRAVRDAILAGETETRSTVHIVTERLDDGPPLLLSRPYPVPEVVAWALEQGQEDVLRRVIWAHQEWMLRDAFGRLMEDALDLLSAGISRRPGLETTR